MIGRRIRLQLLAHIRDPHCDLCPLAASSHTICVMGRGGDFPAPRIHLIGEAPGEAEARTGMPFMGASGQALQRLIDELGLTTHVYISNVCRCRPPNNRKPTTEEVSICTSHYLHHEMRVIQAKVYVLLGRTAIDWARLGIFPFTRHVVTRGLLGTNYVPTICTWHPAYCLRFPKAWKDLRKSLIVARNIAEVR